MVAAMTLSDVCVDALAQFTAIRSKNGWLKPALPGLANVGRGLARQC
jgi:hypothetical protein